MLLGEPRLTLCFELNDKVGTHTNLTFNRYWTTHKLNERFANTQTQACASLIHLLVLFKTAKVHKQFRNVFFRYPASRINYVNLKLNIILSYAVGKDNISSCKAQVLKRLIHSPTFSKGRSATDCRTLIIGHGLSLMYQFLFFHYCINGYFPIFRSELHCIWHEVE